MHNSFFSFIPMLLKLYRCLNHALKTCKSFEYDPQINFYYFFSNFNLVILGYFDDGSEWTVGTVCAQLLLQCYSDSFETLQISWPRFKDTHAVWI